MLNSDTILEDIAALRTVDDARTRRYICALDNAMQKALDEAGDDLPSSVWVKTGDPRSITCAAGYLAFFYAFPKSRHYRNPKLLAGFKAILADVLAHQMVTGELSASGDEGVERPGNFPPHPHSSHGQSWYLEPILFGMNWLKSEFSAEEKSRIDQALYRTADFICGRPIHEMDNRGVIVCAILAMCGRYFKEGRFLEEAIRNFHGVPIRVFDERSGQIFEGSGPDGNYSGTTYEYLYIYRIMSGDESIDRPMIAALKWRGRAHDPNGIQMIMGPSTRVPVGSSGYKLVDSLPAFERYSAQEPFFQALIDQYLPLMERSNLAGPGHSISPCIWALLEHSVAQPPASPPAWYTDMRSWYYRTATGPEHFYYNEGYDSLYFPVRRAYTTSIGARGRAPYQDLQAWTLESEPPVIYPAVDGPANASATRAWGLDTAVQNVSGIKVPQFCWIEGETPALILRWERLWRYYVFTRRTTFILSAGEVGRCEVDWTIDTRVCGEPEPGAAAITYPGRAGRLCFAGTKPAQVGEGAVRVYRVSFANAPFWFALTDDSFGLDHFESGRARFHDADGRYDIQFTFDPGRPDAHEKLMGFSAEAKGHLLIRKG